MVSVIVSLCVGKTSHSVTTKKKLQRLRATAFAILQNHEFNKKKLVHNNIFRNQGVWETLRSVMRCCTFGFPPPCA